MDNCHCEERSDVAISMNQTGVASRSLPFRVNLQDEP